MKKYRLIAMFPVCALLLTGCPELLPSFDATGEYAGDFKGADMTPVSTAALRGLLADT